MRLVVDVTRAEFIALWDLAVRNCRPPYLREDPRKAWNDRERRDKNDDRQG